MTFPPLVASKKYVFANSNHTINAFLIIVTLLTIIVTLLTINVFLVAAEFALVKARGVRIQT